MPDPIGDALRGMGVKTDGAMKPLKTDDGYRAVICLDGGKSLLFVRVTGTNIDDRPMWISTAEVNDVATEEVTQIEDSDWSDAEWSARFKGKEPSTEQPTDATEAARRAISRLKIDPSRYSPCFEKKERPKQQRVTAVPLRVPGFLVPIAVALLVLALVRMATGSVNVASTSAVPTTTSAATSAAATASTAARATATVDPARAPLIVHAQAATYATASSGCGYSVFFAWVVPGYAHEQVTIHLHEVGGASNIDAVQRFAFAQQPLPTMPTNGGYLALGGAYLADKQELVYISGDSGANGGWTAEITAIGDHPISGELISSAPPRACG